MAGVRKGKAAVSILLSLVLSFWCVPAQAFAAGNDAAGSGSAVEGSTTANAMVADVDAVVALSEEATGLEAVEGADAAFEMAQTEQPSEATESSGPTSENLSSASAQVDLASSAQFQANQTETEAAAVALAASVEETSPGVLTEGWTQADTCEWKIEDGALTVRPLGNSENGTIDGRADAWGRDFTSFSIQGKVCVRNPGDLFTNCSNLEQVNLEGLDISSAIDLGFMFYGCKSLTTVDISGLDTSRATNMGYMFAGCDALTSLDLGNFDTSQVTNMNSMFYDCKALVSLNLSGFDTSLVENMSSMFCNCEALSTLGLSSFDTAQATDMSSMFANCKSLNSLDFSGFNTSRVTNMDSMLYGCKSLTAVDVSNFDTSRVTNMSSMFSACSALADLDLSGLNASKVVDMSSMFSGCSSLAELDLANLDISCAGDVSGCFSGCKSLVALDLSKTEASQISNMSRMLEGCSSLTSLDFRGLHTSQVTDMSYLLRGCKSLTSVDMTGLDTSRVTDMRDMFAGCDALTSLDLKSFDTSAVTNMASMFGCEALTNVDVSSFDTSHVTDMSGLFSGCEKLTTLDLSNFDTAQVTNMDSMFSDCKGLVSLDLSGFNTSRVTNMRYMFWNCGSFSELDLSGFDTSAVEDSTDIFYLCKADKVKLGSGFGLGVLPNFEKYTWIISWRNSQGETFEFDAIPSGVTDTYTSVIPIITNYFSVDTASSMYTGEPIEKSIVSVGSASRSSVLTEGVDYSVSYSDNVDAGLASIAIKGLGEYDGELTYEFQIIKAPAEYDVPTGLTATYGQTLADVGLPDGFSWDDPTVSVGDPGNNEFSCSWAGDANHEGASGILTTVCVTRDVEAGMFSFASSERAYTGQAIEPAIGSDIVPEGSFTVSYRDNVEAGTATAIVSGMGYWTGSCELTFEIEKAPAEYTVPVGLVGAYGKTLGDIVLPDDFSWNDPSQTLYSLGDNTYYCSWAGDANHEGASDIAVNVYVRKAPNEKIQWTLGDDGLLTVTGEGEFDLDAYEELVAQKTSIRVVEIGDGITSVTLPELRNAYAVFFLGDKPESIIIYYSGYIADPDLNAEIIEADERQDYGFSYRDDYLGVFYDPSNTTWGSSSGVSLGYGYYAQPWISGMRDLDWGSSLGLGRLGDNCFYYIDADGVLHIKGEGEYGSSGSSANVTFDVKNKILVKKLVVEEGITGLGNSSFPSAEDSMFGLQEADAFPNMTEAEFADSVTAMPSFSGNTVIEKVKLPSTLKALNASGTGVFRNCSALKEVVMPASLETIGYISFENCIALSDIEFPQTLTDIGNSAFEGCASLSKVSLPASLTSIGVSAFSGTAISSLIVPASVTTFYTTALDDCAQLQSIEFLGQIPESFYSYGSDGGRVVYSGQTVTAIHRVNDKSWSDAEKYQMGNFTWYTKQADGTLTEDSYVSPYYSHELTSSESDFEYCSSYLSGKSSGAARNFTLSEKKKTTIKWRAELDSDCSNSSMDIALKSTKGNKGVTLATWHVADGDELTGSCTMALDAGDYYLEVVWTDTHDNNSHGKFYAMYTTPVETQTVYRMYNPITSEHLFTTDKSEYQSLTKHNWKQEGEAWTSPKSGAVGVYRLYNPGLGALAKMSHHYTTDRAEAENLVRNHGWVYDFDGQPCFYSAEDSSGAALSGASAVYRLYNPALSAHHYTLDSSENGSLIARYGWKGEGTGFYAYAS